MIFLINCSNLKSGGGLQVADSIYKQLKFSEHLFVVVLSNVLTSIVDTSVVAKNIKIYTYNIKNELRTLLLGRDLFLDNIVKQEHIDAVLTLFGPSRWKPRVPHLCGFARAQLLLTDSPYYQRLSIKERIVYKIWTWGFRRSSRVFYTENPYISDMLPRLIKGAKVYTVTNYYNQVFDHPEQWKRAINLSDNHNDKGMVTILTVSSTGSHKNLGIMVPVAEYLEKTYPDFEFRFVMTCDKAPFQIPEHLRKHFTFVGQVDVSECPNLYDQADIMFMPTLMECFTATYPEAMRMEVPIVTTDLEFAHGLCRDAACYYDAIDAKAAGEAIYKVATNKAYAKQLTENGKKQLLTFDNYEERADKLIGILEEIVQNTKQ